MVYTWTNNPTQSGTPCNVDDLNSCLMWLKKDYCPRHHMSGLMVSNNGIDINHDITVGRGECADSTDTTKITLSSPMVKKIDANWSPGTNQGGFPSGITLGPNVWYNVFAIMKDDYTVDIGFDVDSGASNLLADASGYNYYRRIGSVKTDGNFNISRFQMIEENGGVNYFWSSPIEEVNVTTIPTVYTTINLNIPSGINILPFLGVSLTVHGATEVVYFRNSFITDVRALDTESSSSDYNNVPRIYARTDATIDYKIAITTGVPTSNQLIIFNNGFFDSRLI